MGAHQLGTSWGAPIRVRGEEAHQAQASSLYISERRLLKKLVLG
jgi:hypothetical protein